MAADPVEAYAAARRAMNDAEVALARHYQPAFEAALLKGKEEAWAFLDLVPESATRFRFWRIVRGQYGDPDPVRVPGGGGDDQADITDSRSRLACGHTP